MDLRIGITLDGRPAGFDTASTRPLALVGEPGRGKTTVARFITRWWLAETTHHAHVFAARPGEWADLRCHLGDLTGRADPVAVDCNPGSCLVVLDDIDPPLPGPTGLLPLERTPTVVTSGGGNLERMERLRGGFTALGLLPRRAVTGIELEICVGQGRLDWPAHTVAVVTDQRGPLDFPCHRWRTMTDRVGALR